MAIIRELYEKLEAERVARDQKKAREAELRSGKEKAFLSESKLHLADVRSMTEKDFRYMAVLERAFADALEYVRPERWRKADTNLDLDDVILSRDSLGRDCLTVAPLCWFKCRSEDERYGIQVPELVSCAMPGVEFTGYFTSAADLSLRERRMVKAQVLEPGSEQLERVLANLDGSQEFVCLPYEFGEGEKGELVLFRDGHVFDSVPYAWFDRFREDHFAPDAVDADRLAVSIALDANHAVRYEDG